MISNMTMAVSGLGDHLGDVEAEGASASVLRRWAERLNKLPSERFRSFVGDTARSLGTIRVALARK
jgi:hypothetical protein